MNEAELTTDDIGNTMKSECSRIIPKIRTAQIPFATHLKLNEDQGKGRNSSHHIVFQHATTKTKYN